MRKSCGKGLVYRARLASLHEIGLRPSVPGTHSVIAPLGAKSQEDCQEPTVPNTPALWHKLESQSRTIVGQEYLGEVEPAGAMTSHDYQSRPFCPTKRMLMPHFLPIYSATISEDPFKNVWNTEQSGTLNNVWVLAYMLYVLHIYA